MASVTDMSRDYDTNAESKRAFQQLKTRLHRQMIDAMDLSKAGKLPEHELRKQLRALASHLCEMHSAYLPDSEREQMVNEIMDEMYGFGPLEPLMNDPEVSD
ncbi:MAG: CpaF family protein, partial [Planctomycetaceae bacterium]|nr:CpaF family protein [Planctomycetaceae bacterium]